MLFYQAHLPLSWSTLRYVARLVRAHRKRTGVRWRVLDSGQQALMTLAWLRKGETYADLAAGFGVSTATVYRRVHETVDVLAAQTVSLPQALRRHRRRGGQVVIVDGTLVKTDRVAADRPYRSITALEVTQRRALRRYARCRIRCLQGRQAPRTRPCRRRRGDPPPSSRRAPTDARPLHRGSCPK